MDVDAEGGPTPNGKSLARGKVSQDADGDSGEREEIPKREGQW